MTYTIDTIEEAYDELEVDEGYTSFGAAVHNFYQNQSQDVDCHLNELQFKLHP